MTGDHSSTLGSTCSSVRVRVSARLGRDGIKSELKQNKLLNPPSQRHWPWWVSYVSGGIQFGKRLWQRFVALKTELSSRAEVEGPCVQLLVKSRLT